MLDLKIALTELFETFRIKQTHWNMINALYYKNGQFGVSIGPFEDRGVVYLEVC